MIVPDLSVAENVFLGSTPRLVSWRELRGRTRDIMREWGFDIAAETPCRELSVEQLQIVEIARALARGAKCVLLDEPTAALERQAVRRLFERVRQLTEGGVAVLYISHHLEEVFEICQDVAVLRDGELVLSAPTAEPQQGRPGRGDGGRPGRPGQPGGGGHARSTRRPRRRGAGRGRPHRGLGQGPPVRGVAAGARRGDRGRHRPAQRGRRHPRPRHRRRGRPFRRRGAAERAPHPVPGGATSPSARASATSRRTAVPRGSSRTWAWPRTSR